MKILHLIDSLEPGGKERQLIELLKGLSNLKCCELELVVMNEDIHYQEVFNFGIKIHYLIRRLKKDQLFFSSYIRYANNSNLTLYIRGIS